MADLIFTDNSDEAVALMKQAVKRALWAMGSVAEGHAKDGTPVDTGRLRNSIAHEEDNDEQAVYIGTNVEYAPYIEEGFKSYPGAHMLRNACANHVNEYKNILKDSMDNA